MAGRNFSIKKKKTGSVLVIDKNSNIDTYTSSETDKGR